MRHLLTTLGAVGLLGGCVVAPPPVAATRPVPVAVAPVAAVDPWCQQERREARTTQQMANQQARQATYGGRRQAYQAAAAQSVADIERSQAQRAC